MKVRSQRIAEPGILEKERLVLDVIQNTDIGGYAVFCTVSVAPDEVSAQVSQAYWFPDKEVKAGDVVVLYTKKGTVSEKDNKDKTTSHFFYWNLDAPLWLDKAAAVLAQFREWETLDLPTYKSDSTD